MTRFSVWVSKEVVARGEVVRELVSASASELVSNTNKKVVTSVSGSVLVKRPNSSAVAIMV